MSFTITTQNKFQFLIERLPKEPESWTKEDVVEWLSIIHMDKYKQNFLDIGVDGWLILDIDENDLETELQIHIKLHRKKVLKG